MFWTGIFVVIYSPVTAISVLFLTIDRLMSLRVFKRSVKTFLFILSLVLVLGACVFCIVTIFLELPLDVAKVGHCISGICLLSKNKNVLPLILKLIVESTTFVCSLIFFYTMRKHQSKNIKNRVVKATLVAEIFLNIIPTFCASCFAMITGQTAANYVGQIVLFLGLIDAACCSVIYSKIFLVKSTLNFQKRAVVATFNNNITKRTSLPT
uniref:G-protein coupled receptors family 1 profile domain-containing protein n=1 Tax=Ditylenchus dipsaci TaxID=166011 RepID=A0A915DNS3_9BILA